MAVITAPLALLSPAKLNLFLRITGQRADGYHSLQTLFQLLDYGDTLQFEATANNKLQLHSNYNAVPAADNLVIRAAKALQQATGCTAGASIRLHKRLPAGAGLGGGSSNAATTLLALNHLWQTGLNLSTLAAIGGTLGADVPVFVGGRSAWAEGIGDQLTPVSLAAACYLVVYPGVSIPTARIFQDKNLTRNSSAITLAAFLKQGAANDCENTVRSLYPQVDNALNFMEKYQFKLTGTGSCIFGKFHSAHDAETVQTTVPANWHSFVANGVNVSPVHQQLARISHELLD